MMLILEVRLKLYKEGILTRKQLRRKRERLYGLVEEKAEKMEDKVIVEKPKRGRKKKDE